MWFMEKDVWEKNGWTSTVGAEKSSFDKEAGKLALDRFQAGVTTFTDLNKFKSDIQEKERLALRKSISGLEGLVAARVNNSSGLYGGVFEPSFDIEFSVSKNPDGSTKSISNQISEIIRVASQPERVQSDVFVSQIVPIDHPNARPIMEVGFKKGASWDDISEAVAAFQENGIDGFTMARDDRGNVIGLRAQYIPEFSAVYDSLDHLDPQMVASKMQDWVSRANAASTALDQIDNVSYKKNGTVSTIVYGLEEYATARPIEPGSTSRAAELGRRRSIAEQRRQVSSGPDAGQAVEPGAGGLPASAGDVQPAGSASQGEVGGQRYMPAADREVTRAVNINDDSQDFTGQILKGQKTIETRDTLNNAMQGVLGQRIGLVRTGIKDTKVVGYATVAKEPIVYRNESEFRRDKDRHQVAPGSKYDIKKGGVKYGYELTDVVSVEPFAPKSVGRMYSVIEPRYMPAGDMATGRSVKDHREAMDLFEKGYRLYGALYDGMEDPIRLKKASEIEKYDPENLWAVPSKKIAAAISIRNMPADIKRDIGRNLDFANPPTDSEAVDALSSEKKAKFGAARSIKPGTQVAARIDIPAFLRTGKYVVAVHEPDGEAGGPGKVIGYDTVTRLQNPKFVVKPGVQRIYEGKSAKFPVATVDGKIMADRSIPSDLENYVPVGMDPKEHAYFYDKRTDQPVISGSEAVSVGNTVFVKNPVYGKPEDFRFMPSPDSAMPGAYSFPGGYRAIPGKAKGSLRLYGPAGSLVGIASSLDEAQRILRRKNK